MEAETLKRKSEARKGRMESGGARGSEGEAEAISQAADDASVQGALFTGGGSLAAVRAPGREGARLLTGSPSM